MWQPTCGKLTWLYLVISQSEMPGQRIIRPSTTATKNLITKTLIGCEEMHP